MYPEIFYLILFIFLRIYLLIFCYLNLIANSGNHVTCKLLNMSLYSLFLFFYSVIHVHVLLLCLELLVLCWTFFPHLRSCKYSWKIFRNIESKMTVLHRPLAVGYCRGLCNINETPFHFQFLRTFIMDNESNTFFSRHWEGCHSLIQLMW